MLISRAYGRPATAPSWAFRIFDEATICMAFVIWAVFLTDRIRRRMSRVLGMAGKNGGWSEARLATGTSA
jgi:hypothetical protein